MAFLGHAPVSTQDQHLTGRIEVPTAGGRRFEASWSIGVAIPVQ
jgi:hypothetical protein